MKDKNKNKGVNDIERQDFVAQKPAKGRSRTLKVRRIGNSLGVVLPKEVLGKLGVGEGDELSLLDTPGGVALAPADAETSDLLRMAEEIMHKRRKVLKALAQ